ncbi:glycosyl hydrolase 115 family protein [Alteromonas confluentis]|uniref:Gylcosyl hydrolase 115 C-terminal domain-containing protein n=1 Tax=Alteromonas confluentis TaxID=1656094 RepID=A0A1E7Z851_9ALTE|nr:glycosyl hydrolase 115 family protein [Alteromonas confluentis]OFC69631.1 hypothetical protein BFC18_16275 [Alteromonas confluentis]
MKFAIAALLLCIAAQAHAYLNVDKAEDAFPLVDNEGKAAILLIDDDSPPGLQWIADTVSRDIEKVSGVRPRISNHLTTEKSPIIIAGIVGESRHVGALASRLKLDLTTTASSWDGYHIESLNDGGRPVWLIAGNNLRGVEYGLLDLSEKIGVSPWYWWADIPVLPQASLYLNGDTRIEDAPKVQYRGIFLNDEAPALTKWAKKKFGGFNAKFYKHIFDLLLRLKGNFLWPAMWDSAFADDDKQNAELAAMLGIVMSTSHHEPMMRADVEWNRYGKGPWDYAKNPQNIYMFWEEGAKRYRDKPAVFTLGMRGQADTPMSENQNIALLEQIVADQRNILTSNFPNTRIEDIPQVWTLYKEVQSYYENGMRVPDDVTLLWSDDNFGNIRRLPTDEEAKRVGGAGVYYHFDYVGGPRSYRWINTVPLGKIYEQMSLAYRKKARKIWIANVGDLKPMELPIDFFLKMAWDPESFDGRSADKFLAQWSSRMFPGSDSESITDIIKTTLLVNGQRKPEALDSETYSIINYDEALRYSSLLATRVKQADDVKAVLNPNLHDAFFQLVEHPLRATQAVFELNHQLALNNLFGAQRRAEINGTAQSIREWFARDGELTNIYHEMNNGRWDGMMLQPHIGYVHWRNPPANLPPAVSTKALVEVADMGVAVEGSLDWWPAIEFRHEKLELPPFTRFGKKSRSVFIYNRQASAFPFSVTSKDSWIVVSQEKGVVNESIELKVTIDWSAVPERKAVSGSFTVVGTGWGGAVINVFAENEGRDGFGFMEGDGVLSIEAANSHVAIEEGWETLVQHGRTGKAIRYLPQHRNNGSKVTYPVHFAHKGDFPVYIEVSPTQKFNPESNLLFGLSLDDFEPVWLSALGEDYLRSWENDVLNNVRVIKTTIHVPESGQHLLTLWGKDEGVVVQKIIVDTGGLKPSFLGPPQSQFKQKEK